MIGLLLFVLGLLVGCVITYLWTLNVIKSYVHDDTRSTRIHGRDYTRYLKGEEK